MWYLIDNIDEYDTPALVIYKERAGLNIDRAIAAVGSVEKLRPHVKTHKSADITRMMMDRGITKFKCATIAEAEMLAIAGAKDILLAYQPVGPKALRFLQLVKNYPDAIISCAIDNIDVAKNLAHLFETAEVMANIYLDINSGMNRTGVMLRNANIFLDEIKLITAVNVVGIHVYDGHIKDDDLSLRQKQSDEAFEEVKKIIDYAEEVLAKKMTVVAGGSPTFLTHINRDVECSPGTFVFWDWGYHQHYPAEPYDFAAVVVTRIISIVDEHTITTDLGYKAVASENPLSFRVHFLNLESAVPVSHSEEHLSVRVPDTSSLNVGDVLYGIPIHICPTVAMYNEALVVEDNEVSEIWKISARARSIGL